VQRAIGSREEEKLKNNNCLNHFVCIATRAARGGAKTPNRIVIKFCTGVEVPDIINSAKYGDHRLRVFGDSVGQISYFSIELH